MAWKKKEVNIRAWRGDISPGELVGHYNREWPRPSSISARPTPEEMLDTKEEACKNFVADEFVELHHVSSVSKRSCTRIEHYDPFAEHVKLVNAPSIMSYAGENKLSPMLDNYKI